MTPAAPSALPGVAVERYVQCSTVEIMEISWNYGKLLPFSRERDFFYISHHPGHIMRFTPLPTLMGTGVNSFEVRIRDGFFVYED